MDSKRKQKSASGAPVESSGQSSGAELSTRKAVGARLVEARGSMNQDEFADLLGVSPGTVGRYERGERLPDAEFLLALAEKRKISTEWVLLGVPPMTMEGLEAKLAARAEAWSEAVARELSARYGPDEAFALVPLYDVRAAAGHGALVDDRPPADHWAFSRAWLSSSVRVPPSRLALITVSGSSMEPDLHDGDVIMIDRTDVDVLREGVYVFQLDGHVFVKQLQLLDGKLVIISRNDGEFPLQEVSVLQENTTFRLLGRVIGQPTFRRF